MRIRQYILLPALLAVVMSVPALSQEIFEASPGLFSTTKLQDRASVTGKTVVIRSASTLRGTLNISIGEEGTIAAVYVKKAATSSRARAIDFIDLIALDLSRTPQGARVDMRAPNPAPWVNQEMGLLEADLKVPPGCAIEIDAVYFDVAATGPFTSVVVPSSMGRIEVSDVSERLEVETANRQVEVEGITGDISVTTSNAPLQARNITCLETQARFRNDGGDIEIEGCVGQLSVKNDYGRIEIIDFEPHSRGNLIRGFSAPVFVDITHLVDGHVVISNRYEDIDVNIPTNLSARLSLTVDEDGRIEALNFPFRADGVQTDRLNLVTGAGEGLIKASVRGQGNIYIRGEDAGE